MEKLVCELEMSGFGVCCTVWFLTTMTIWVASKFLNNFWDGYVLMTQCILVLYNSEYGNKNVIKVNVDKKLEKRTVSRLSINPKIG